jgi:uncharacterized protein YlxW (UPF0749 family)
MKEDPLERLEREEREKKNGGLKTVMYALAAVAVLLAAALAYVWFQKSSLVKDLNIEKQDLTEQIVALQQDYNNLSSDYEAINSQLDSSREEVSQLVERIKQTDATNRAKMREYEKELGTLRSIMRNYIVQIDSLNTLNQQLSAEADAARADAASSRRQNEALNRQVNELSGQVAAGSVIKARGIILEPYNSQDKVTDRSSRVVRMLTTLSLVENDLAPKGPVRVYIVVKDPDGNVVTNANSVGFESAGQARTASASREVDYEGKEVELSIYLNDLTDRCIKGVYSVEAYTTQGFLGSAETMLR